MSVSISKSFRLEKLFILTRKFVRTFKDLLENILFFVVLARVIGKLRQIFKLSIICSNVGSLWMFTSTDLFENSSILYDYNSCS